MPFFGLVKNKCFYCRNPIEKNGEVLSDVKILGYNGTYRKKFCSEEHVSLYHSEIREASNKHNGKGCC